MQFSEILNIVLGGGLIATIIAILTLRATVRKAEADAKRAQAEAEKAKAEAQSVRIDNVEHATAVLVNNIVKPLEEELGKVHTKLTTVTKKLDDAQYALRNNEKAMGAMQREMARLRKAIDAANRCEHHDACPVLYKLRELPKRSKNDDGAVGEDKPPPTDAITDDRQLDADACRYDGAVFDKSNQ